MKYLLPSDLIYLGYIYIIARNRVGRKIKRYLMMYSIIILAIMYI